MYCTESVQWSSAGHATTTVQSVTIYTVHMYTQLPRQNGFDGSVHFDSFNTGGRTKNPVLLGNLP